MGSDVFEASALADAFEVAAEVAAIEGGAGGGGEDEFSPLPTSPRWGEEIFPEGFAAAVADVDGAGFALAGVESTLAFNGGDAGFQIQMGGAQAAEFGGAHAGV